MPLQKKKSSHTLLNYLCRGPEERKDRLSRINKLINWTNVENCLQSMSRGKDATGRPAYSPLFLYKCLLLQRLYKLSDEELEYNISDRVSFQKFIGLSVSDNIPDASTFCRFRNELSTYDLSEILFKEILRQITESGFELKTGIAVDATVIPSARHPRKVMENPPKDREEPDETADSSGENESGEECKISYSDDSDAAWTRKGNKAIYGYKAHIANAPESGLILSAHITPANRSDMKELGNILSGVDPKFKGDCYADKGYASEENRSIVKKYGYSDKIMYKAVKNTPLSDAQKKENDDISAIRSGIERIFGTLKRSLGMTRLRYIGLGKVTQEFMLAATAYNLLKFSKMSVS